MAGVYKSLKEKNIKVFEVLQYHLNRIVIGIQRKISFKQTFTKPFQIEIVEYLEATCFYQFFKAVSDYSEFGRKVTILRDKRENQKST